MRIAVPLWLLLLLTVYNTKNTRHLKTEDVLGVLDSVVSKAASLRDACTNSPCTSSTCDAPCSLMYYYTKRNQGLSVIRPLHVAYTLRSDSDANTTTDNISVTMRTFRNVTFDANDRSCNFDIIYRGGDVWDCQANTTTLDALADTTKRQWVCTNLGNTSSTMTANYTYLASMTIESSASTYLPLMSHITEHIHPCRLYTHACIYDHVSTIGEYVETALFGFVFGLMGLYHVMITLHVVFEGMPGQCFRDVAKAVGMKRQPDADTGNATIWQLVRAGLSASFSGEVMLFILFHDYYYVIVHAWALHVAMLFNTGMLNAIVFSRDEMQNLKHRVRNPFEKTGDLKCFAGCSEYDGWFHPADNAALADLTAKMSFCVQSNHPLTDEDGGALGTDGKVVVHKECPICLDDTCGDGLNESVFLCNHDATKDVFFVDRVCKEQMLQWIQQSKNHPGYNVEINTARLAKDVRQVPFLADILADIKEGRDMSYIIGKDKEQILNNLEAEDTLGLCIALAFHYDNRSAITAFIHAISPVGGAPRASYVMTARSLWWVTPTGAQIRHIYEYMKEHPECQASAGWWTIDGRERTATPPLPAETRLLSWIMACEWAGGVKAFIDEKIMTRRQIGRIAARKQELLGHTMFSLHHIYHQENITDYSHHQQGYLLLSTRNRLAMTALDFFVNHRMVYGIALLMARLK